MSHFWKYYFGDVSVDYHASFDILNYHICYILKHWGVDINLRELKDDEILRKKLSKFRRDHPVGKHHVGKYHYDEITMPSGERRNILCRFEGGMVGRIVVSCERIEDTLSDLEQMVMNPDRFLHGDHLDKWKIVFEDTLHGREAEVEALLIAADRVTRVKEENARGDRLFKEGTV